jgi:UrcA family protein
MSPGSFKERKMFTPARLLSMLAACALVSPAFAAERAPAESDLLRREPVTMKFRFDPRDLQTREGAERVYRKLERAARRQCTTTGTKVRELRVDEQCIAELVKDGVARTGSVLLAEVHRGAESSAIAARR